MPLLTPFELTGSGDREERITQRNLPGSGAFGESVNLTEKVHKNWLYVITNAKSLAVYVYGLDCMCHYHPTTTL